MYDRGKDKENSVVYIIMCINCTDVFAERIRTLLYFRDFIFLHEWSKLIQRK